ncbi:MAG: hypothetical protein GY950_04220 [bacterium]|nr:hypothetical protein [bacterium]
MKKRLVLSLTLLLAFVLTGFAAPASLQTSLVPDNAQWVLHLDVAKFASTNLSDLLFGEKNGKFSMYRGMVTGMLKIDLLKDISGVTVFGMGHDKDSNVVCWTGKFDKDHLLSMLGKDGSLKEIPHGKYTIYNWGGDHYGVFAGDRLAVTGEDETAVKNALDVLAGKKRNMKASKMTAHFKGMPGGAFLKGFASDISSLVHDHDTTMILKNAGMAFFVALEKNGDLTMKLNLSTHSPETAKNIQQVVTGFIAMAKMRKGSGGHGPGPWWELMEKLKIQLVNNTVIMELSYPSDRLIEMLPHEKHRKKDKH